MRLVGIHLLLPLAACAPADEADDPLVVDLAWYGDAPGSWDEARAGLWWALSNLGAAPTDEAALVVTEEGDAVALTLDLAAVGFPEDRLPDVADAVAPVKAWSEGPVDLGRFLMATLYEPGRYYAITGACATLGEWRAARQAAEPALYAVTVSQLVPGDRLVELNVAPTDGDVDGAVGSLAWLASEGEGSLEDASFAAHEFETVDVMANGQQRFAVYDGDGELRAAAALSAAGQPGKCMWCHEGNVQRGTPENPSAPGYLDHAAFVAEVEAAEAWMAAARATVPAVDFSAATHEWAEQLSVGFLEPSPERVALEWGVSVDEVRAEGLPTHENAEYPDLGERYDRADVDAARARREPGWAPLDTPSSDREAAPDRALAGASPACTPGANAR